MSLYSSSNPRPGIPGIIITLCWITLFCLVAGFALSYYRQSRLLLSPELRAASQALSNHDLMKARQDFDAALKGHPDSPALYVAIAGVCKDAKQWGLGAEYLQRSVSACKDQPNTTRAELYSLLANYLTEAEPEHPQKEAIEAAQRALELAPDEPDMLNLLGYILADNDQDLNRAEEYIKRALRLAAEQKNDSPEGAAQMSAIEDSYGWVLYKKGNYPGAVDALTQAIADIPENGLPSEDQKVYYYHLGAANRKAGRIEAARRALLTALQFDRDYAPAKSELAALPPETPSSPVASTPTPQTTAPQDHAASPSSATH